MAAPAPTPAPAAAPPAAAGGFTTEALAAQVQAYAVKYTPKAAKAKLAEYGYAGAQSVPAEFIPFMMQHLAT